MLAELLDALAHVRPAAVRSELQGSTDAPEQARIAPLFVVGSRVELGRVRQRRRRARACWQADSIPFCHLLDVLLLEDLECAGRGDMEVRVCTGGEQPWKQGCGNAEALQDWVLYAKEADLEYRYV